MLKRKARKEREALLERIEKLHQEEKHGEIVALIQSIPEEGLDCQLKGLLARGIMSMEDPDWLYARGLLIECAEEESDYPGWNFRMGYNYYHMDQVATALWYFQREIEVNPKDPNKAVTEEFIRECKTAIDTGAQISPINVRAKKFWNRFLDVEEVFFALINSDNNVDDYMKALHMLSNSLELVGVGAGLELELKEKPGIIFSPEGLHGRAIVLKQLIKLAPKEVTDKYNLILGRERNGIDMELVSEGISLDAKNTFVTYKLEEDMVILYLKNQDLLSLNKKSKTKDQAMWFAYTLADGFLGERYCMNYVEMS